MTKDIDCIVVGAGVVGLAIARALARDGREVMILEASDAFGTGTSSRNSEVIHAGIYYPPGSLKARLCVAGRDELYRYCAARGIPHRRSGKFIVATDDRQIGRLEGIRLHAARCGVDDLTIIEGGEAMAMEPALRCVAALHSPSTGIVDSHSLMQSLLAEAEDAGGQLVLATEVLDGVVEDGGVRLRTRSGGGEPFEITTDLLVNAAGLDAVPLAARLAGFPSEHVPAIRYAKGNYFAAPGRSPFSRLIYPVPVDGGLGVHLTFDLGGQMRFGPDVEWIETIDYGVDPRRADAFYEDVRRYWPMLPDNALTPAYCGIRPKLAGPGEPAADFRIEGPQHHGIGSVINLFGIESPGLTSSLAIAELVLALAG
ncbi:NAD(P)/FAD-dependent oxidoreductase [Mangrovibrevibacter kandeliae]|uniref:NAD(P)/FAD-dependent oxidoreductase n=1 Tax=Mangrovibrevibacter kandeliae TaxID=2968473 RepID=UPI002118FBB0|nr:NAD(P)/FAD-dependent oxidoreductase [Aurantimonas sp. CSK15Z-1]MCQ8782829.1 NAD(P)/FAD-dependent oxidoreductase [Aurantimonas sp. CSK15Z-1]